MKTQLVRRFSAIFSAIVLILVGITTAGQAANWQLRETGYILFVDGRLLKTPVVMPPSSGVNTPGAKDIPTLLSRAGIPLDNVKSPSLEGGDYQWHTFYQSYGKAIAIDNNGGLYITGSSNDTWSGPEDQEPLHAHSGGTDILVLKLNAAGTYQWHTFYGTNADYAGSDGVGIATGSNGEVYITGYGGPWSGPEGQEPLHAHSGISSVYPNTDIVVLKLDTTGAYQWHTYYGALRDSHSFADDGDEIAVDENGHIYITGDSGGSWSGPEGQEPLHRFIGYFHINNIFVLKLNAAGTYQWHTFYGSEASHDGNGIAVDNNGGVYITGKSSQAWSGPEGQEPLHVYSGIYYSDIFVLKLDAAGAYQWHTFYGSTDNSSFGKGIGTDASGDVYITGSSGCSWSGPDNQAPLHSHSGNPDIVALKLNSAGAYQWHTFYGSTGYDQGESIAIDNSGGLYITGSSNDTWSGPEDQAPLHIYSGGNDILALKLNTTGAYQWHTFYGTSDAGGGDYSYGVALDSDRGVFVAGSSIRYSWNGPEGQAPLHAHSGSYCDIVVLKLVEAHTPVILVEDEMGNPINGAQVFRNRVMVGETSTVGTLQIPDLQVKDELIARLQITEVPTDKDNHDQDSTENWAYRVYITSLDIPQSKDPAPKVVADTSITQTLTISKNNTLIGFNIVTSVEWDANASYLDELKRGFLYASDYLYDATDGQMILERVTIYDNNQHMKDADYQIRASNQEWPRAHINGILSGSNLHIFLGRYFDGGSSNQGIWTDLAGYRAQIHEFGHYGLSLYDSYFYYDDIGLWHDSDCTSAAIRDNNTDDINATLMDFARNASEFSMQNVLGLWSNQCKDTQQWRKNGQSDWETIVENYQDDNSPPRWELKTPSDYSGVVSGPDLLEATNGWSIPIIGDDASTGVCEPPITIRAEHFWGEPASGISVSLRKGERVIYQGNTDDNGEIIILGASDGDQVLINLFGIELWINSIEVDCSTLRQTQSINTHTRVITLLPAAFMMDISTLPGNNTNQIRVVIRISTELSNTPETYLTQHGATSVILVPLNYDAILQAYTGTVNLDANLPSSGNIIAEATNATSQTVEVATQFSFEPATFEQDITIWSSDGKVALYLPSGSLSADGLISITPGQVISSLPNGQILIGGPYTILGDDSLALVNNVNLSLYYLDTGGTLNHVDISSAQIYQWDGQSWKALPSTFSQNKQVVSTVINKFGTFALMADRQEKIFIPLILGGQNNTQSD